MKQMTSLEEERRALLEQIHASRETYRRMLTQSESRSRKLTGGTIASTSPSHTFPRSMTMRWIVGHPYMSAATVAAIAVLGARTTKNAKAHRNAHNSPPLAKGRKYSVPAAPNEMTGTRRTARTRSTDFPQYGKTATPKTVVRSLLTSMVTLGAMLLRDPRKMQVATSAITAAAAFLQSRRRQPVQHQAHTVRIK